MVPAMNDEERNFIEAVIDRIGMAETLEGIAMICGLKSEHLVANWQDQDAAGRWDKVGEHIEKAAALAKVLLP